MFAVLHSLRVFRHYLLGGGRSDRRAAFDLRTDNQAITWLKTNRNLNKVYVRWLDEIEDFRCEVTHLPGSRNPTDPLSRRGFARGSERAPSSPTPSIMRMQTRVGRGVRRVRREAWISAPQDRGVRRVKYSES